MKGGRYRRGVFSQASCTRPLPALLLQRSGPGRRGGSGVFSTGRLWSPFPPALGPCGVHVLQCLDPEHTLSPVQLLEGVPSFGFPVSAAMASTSYRLCELWEPFSWLLSGETFPASWNFTSLVNTSARPRGLDRPSADTWGSVSGALSSPALHTFCCAPPNPLSRLLNAARLPG